MKDTKNRLVKAIRSIKPWYLLVLTIVSALICVYALRANNEHMNDLRNQVYSADNNGGNVEAALENLAKYVTSNMNTNLSSGPNGIYPPIQLTHSYDQVSSNDSQSLSQQNSTLYTQAEDYCQAEIPNGFSGRYRVPCIEQYVTTHGLQSANVPSALYEFDFISPTWSPDLAGWTMLLSILLAALTLVSFIVHWIIKRSLKRSKAQEPEVK
ncbi:MAG TPA: hypothetical protein VGF75_07940 [Candidatus Saccharimonadales bacterium]|jgi:cbb3-type cytochrome oxidase subunit 3